MFVYILINSLMYLIFGIWCAVAPESTANSVGFTLNGQQGLAEYIAVYGGLETSIGIILLICLVKSNYYRPAVISLSIFYFCLASFRTSSLVRYGTDIGVGVNFFIFEIIFLIWGILLLYKYGESK